MALRTIGTVSNTKANAYGSIPNLPSTSGLQSNMANILENAIPGYSGLTQKASGVIGSALGGQLPGDVNRNIQDAAAAQAVSSGMPGSSRVSGSLMGNRVLRDIGLTSLQRQDKGVGDLIGFLQGVSGTAAPTFGQAQEQENARSQYAAAPDPSAAAGEQERLFNKYSNPALGTIPSLGKGGPQFNSLLEKRLFDSGGWYSIDPLTGVPRRY